MTAGLREIVPQPGFALGCLTGQDGVLLFCKRQFILSPLELDACPNALRLYCLQLLAVLGGGRLRALSGGLLRAGPLLSVARFETGVPNLTRGRLPQRFGKPPGRDFPSLHPHPITCAAIIKLSLDSDGVCFEHKILWEATFLTVTNFTNGLASFLAFNLKNLICKERGKF